VYQISRQLENAFVYFHTLTKRKKKRRKKQSQLSKVHISEIPYRNSWQKLEGGIYLTSLGCTAIETATHRYLQAGQDNIFISLITTKSSQKRQPEKAQH